MLVCYFINFKDRYLFISGGYEGLLINEKAAVVIAIVTNTLPLFTAVIGKVNAIGRYSYKGIAFAIGQVFYTAGIAYSVFLGNEFPRFTPSVVRAAVPCTCEGCW